MTYEETINYMFSQLPMYQRIGKAAYKADLDITIKLDKYLGQAHRNFKTIHVAGTNGKGSVSHTIASVLQEAGYNVGLYTSPHYLDFRERIKINGQMIDKNFVIDFIQKNMNFFKTLNPSFFEMTVAMAFEYFSERNVDVAVIEVGLGGRLDSTNIITPLISVITSIGLDHTQFLGNTLKQIAKEKAGIIKPGIPVVIGDTKVETKNVFHIRAQEIDAPIFFADHFFNVRNYMKNIDDKLVFSIEKNGHPAYEGLEFGLIGEYQRFNVPTILLTLEQLNKHFNFTKDDIYNGFANVVSNTGAVGRWQKLNHSPTVICDSGHNPDAIFNVVEQLNSMKFNKLHIIFGMVNDKDFGKILKILPKYATYYFTKASIPRALDEKELKKQASLSGLDGETFETVDLAIKSALEKSNGNDLIFIGGSIFVAAEAISFFKKT